MNVAVIVVVVLRATASQPVVGLHCYNHILLRKLTQANYFIATYLSIIQSLRYCFIQTQSRGVGCGASCGLCSRIIPIRTKPNIQRMTNEDVNLERDIKMEAIS